MALNIFDAPFAASNKQPPSHKRTSTQNSALNLTAPFWQVSAPCTNSDRRCTHPASLHAKNELDSRHGEGMLRGARNMLTNDISGLTNLLNLGLHGDAAAGDLAFGMVYAQMRKTAAAQLGANRHATLSPTELVNETYLKLVSSAQLALNSRKHFFALCARAMRQLLIDRQRQSIQEKQGGGLRQIELDDNLLGDIGPTLDFVDLDRALLALNCIDERAAQVVELHFFAGLNFLEIAELLAVSDKTVRRDWNSARAFLLLQISP
jgi:RNA polymerase sigma factor (TIGR02999 family)